MKSKSRLLVPLLLLLFIAVFVCVELLQRYSEDIVSERVGELSAVFVPTPSPTNTTIKFEEPTTKLTYQDFQSEFQPDPPRQAGSVRELEPDSGELWSEETFVSPNGDWTVVSRSYEPDPNYEQDPDEFLLHRQTFAVFSENQTWLAIDEMENWGLGVGSYAPLLWFNETLYFTYRPIPDGSGSGASGSNLWSLDLNTGMVQKIAPSQIRYGIHVALSADATQFVYNIENGFAIYNLETGQIRQYNVQIAQTVIHLAWINPMQLSMDVGTETFIADLQQGILIKVN